MTARRPWIVGIIFCWTLLLLRRRVAQRFFVFLTSSSIYAFQEKQLNYGSYYLFIYSFIHSKQQKMSVTSDQEINQHIVHDVIQANYNLLEAVAHNDWTTYEKYVDSTITCFEPEAGGNLVEGTDFHKYYFQQSPSSKKSKSIIIPTHAAESVTSQNTMSRPHVRLLNQHAAVVSYVRLVQSVDSSGAVQVNQYEETRVWQNKNMDGWKNVHMHRSHVSK